jgi:hydroxymethylbilane synthase
MRITLGTRGSQLALAQTELVKLELERLSDPPEVSVRIIKTTGDQRLDLSLSQPGPMIEKGFFTKELEEALVREEIDAAIHSLKDLPTSLPQGLELVATLARHDPCDVLISKTARSLTEIPQNAIVATGSPRRSRQLVFRRPDLQVADIRGNVLTRLSKLLREDSWNAIVLAKAGLQRVGFDLADGKITFDSSELLVSDLVEMLPAVGQGAIAVETAAHRAELKALFGQVNDANTWFCTQAERELLRLLGGGCQAPIGVQTRIQGGTLYFEAIVFDNQSKPQSGAVSGAFNTPQAAATALITKLYGSRR